jgi:phosphoribosylanthranilate isomerase
LNADNICKAIDTVHPWGIDLSSSLESKPGIKDHEKMQAFFKVLYEKCANEMNNI